MRTEKEVKAMLKLFDDADETGSGLSDEAYGVRDALLWVMMHGVDDDLEDYLPED